MGFRFRKRLKIAPGLHLNLSKKGIGIGVGAKGLTVSKGPSGSRMTASLPGTGLMYQKNLKGKARTQGQAQPRNVTVEIRCPKCRMVNPFANNFCEGCGY